MPSKSEIEALQTLVSTRGLIAPSIYYTMDADQISEYYNGIGPDFLPGFVRHLITDILHPFAAAAMIHDLRYSFGTGIDADWHSANNQFYDNCQRLLKGGTSWWQIFRRASLRLEVRAMFDAVESSDGRRAYYEARHTSHGARA